MDQVNTHENSRYKKKQTMRMIQININGLRSKMEELGELARRAEADMVTVQETKLTANHKTPKLNQYTPIRQDRKHKRGRWLHDVREE
jgi:exonuclease III